MMRMSMAQGMVSWRPKGVCDRNMSARKVRPVVAEKTRQKLERPTLRTASLEVRPLRPAAFCPAGAAIKLN